jgi:hypothetical protein
MVIQESTYFLEYRLRNPALEMKISQSNSIKYSKSLSSVCWGLWPQRLNTELFPE